MTRDWTQEYFDIKGDEPDAYATLKQQLDIACNTLALYSTSPYPNPAKAALERIAELGGDYSHYFEKVINNQKKK